MSIVNPSDTVERQNEKLLQITEALMHRVEASSADAPEFLDLEFSDLGIQRPAQANRITARPTRLSGRGTHPAPDRNVGGLHRALKRTQDLQSQLMQAQEAADLLRRDLGDITEAMTEGFALFDARDCLVICNSRFCRDFRDTVTDLQPGVSLQACVTQISQSQHLRLVDTDSPQNWARRWMHQHLDASAPFNVALSDDRWLQVSAHRTADGGTTVVHADITDAVRRARDAGSRQRDKQTRLIRATLDSLNQGVGIFDEHDQLLAWNAKLGAVLGIPAHRLYVGAVFEALLDDLTAEMRFADLRDRSDLFRWARTPSGRRPISFDVERDGGIHLQIFASALPARDPSDREVRAQDTQRGSGIVLSCTDVSAERDIAHTLSELNAQLEHRVLERTLELESALSTAERANASKTRFVAAASHDLLQPLSAAKLFINAATDPTANDPKGLALQKAETAIASAEGIIDALLDISKLDSDQLRFDVRAVALCDILDPLRDEMGVLAARKGLRLSVLPSRLMVQTDPAYLRRILQNLISNAIRHTSKGRVVVGVRRNGGSARIEVWDTGPGIARSDQRAIFEEFHRLESSDSAGLGLGLAIVERACARLGHALGLWSHVGWGSCFMLNLPIAGRAMATPTGHPPIGAIGQGLGDLGLIVLLVEDDVDQRQVLATQIEAWGLHVIEADDANEALNLLSELGIRPDAILVGYHLGTGPNGGDLCQAIFDDMGPIPAAILTADRSAQVRRVCRTLNLDLLLKPLDHEKLADVLGRAELAALS